MQVLIYVPYLLVPWYHDGVAVPKPATLPGNGRTQGFGAGFRGFGSMVEVLGFGVRA